MKPENLSLPTQPKVTRLLIFILGALGAVAPLSIDMYLPSLPSMQAHFGATEAQVATTLSSYFIGMALGQLVYGSVSDAIGRRGPLLFGLGLYALASLGCVLAPDVYSLIALRFLQAAGGCAGIVISRAIVRDCFPPQEMARVLSMLTLIMGVAPILAPLIGGQLQAAFGWQSIFILLTFAGFVFWFSVFRFVPETRQGAVRRYRLSEAIGSYAHLLSHRRFMGYALSGTVAQAGMFAYIASSSFVFIEHYGVPAEYFGFIFGSNAVGIISASQVNRWLLRRHASEKVLRMAYNALLVSGLVMCFTAFTGIGGMWGIIVPLWCCITSLGFTFPNALAAAMAPFGDRAGSASALLGTLQFAFAAVSSFVVGQLHDDTAWPMAITILGCALLAQVLLRVLVKPVPANIIGK